MSETAPERGGGADSFFSRKYGPLPGWGWAAIAAGGAGAYILYKRRQAATTSAASTGDGNIPYDYAPQIATLQQEIQDLQSGAGQSPTIPPLPSTSGGNVAGFTPNPSTPVQQPSSNPQASVFTGAPVAAAVFTAPAASAGPAQVTAARAAPAPAARTIIPTTPARTAPTRLPLGLSVNNAQRLGVPSRTIVAGSVPPRNLPLGLSVNNARRLGL